MVAAAGWCALASIAAIAVPSWLGLTVHPAHAAFQMGLPYFGLAASCVLLVGVLLRRPALSTGAGVLVAGLLLPAVAPSVQRSLEPERPYDVDVLVANLLVENSTPDAKVAQIMSADADVLVLTELTPDFVARFQAAGVDERYPHQILHPETHPYGEGIYSRLPLVSSDLRAVGRHLAPEVTIEVDGALVDIMAVHVSAPVVRHSLAWWEEELAALGEVSQQLERPTIWAGDFNASRWHPRFAALLTGPMDDVHTQAGLGLTTSWPNRGLASGLGPFTRLDHALVYEVDVVEVRDLPPTGSDHTPFVMRVRPSSG